MGHSVITCDSCGAYVMEGRNEWECDRCGWCYPPKGVDKRRGVQQEIENAIHNLRDVLEQHSPEECVRYSVIFTARGFDVEQSFRSAGQLKTAGISMRNLKGEFIE